MVAERVLVTGATGFLGGRLAHNLTAQGRSVRAIGRNEERGRELTADGIDFQSIDLADTVALAEASDGIDTVVHAAALSSAWAPREAFVLTNVMGTAAMLAAARQAGVERFIHVSSPAVLSRFADQYDLCEDSPLPAEHTSLYGETKAAAERLVEAEQGLETVLLRPKAIYGPGDTALLPRLVELSARRRLPTIGSGQTVTNLTHVDDVVRAIEATIDLPAPGRCYHIAGSEPVELWPLITELLHRLGRPPPGRPISLDRAMTLATAMERIWTKLHLGGEPPLTRYKVAIVGYSQTLDTSRARDELGFEPKISIAEGLDEVVAHLAPQGSSVRAPRPATTTASEQHCRANVAIDFVSVGTASPPGALVGERGRGRTEMPNLVALVRHPERGIVLFDTGYGRARDHDRSTWWRGYCRLIGPSTRPLTDALAELGVTPDKVAMCILSHFDPDHCGGLWEIPDAKVVCSETAWEHASKALARRSPWRRIAADAMAPLDGQLELVDLGKPGAEHDLFGDGSIVLVALDGHTPGHIGIRVAPNDGTRYLLCGDAVWTIGELGRDHMSANAITAHDRQAGRASRRALRAAMAADPKMVLVPSHCPEAVDRLIGPGWRTRPDNRFDVAGASVR